MQLKNKGMTIVEILVASLILSIVLLGYIQTQMRSIINTEYSSKVNLISSNSNDFSSIFSHFLINEKDDIDKIAIINSFKGGNWGIGNYDANINQCNEETDLEDIDYCDKEMMIKFLIKNYKEGIKETIPEALFSFDDCASTDNICLMVAWSGSVAVEFNRSFVGFYSDSYRN